MNRKIRAFRLLVLFLGIGFCIFKGDMVKADTTEDVAVYEELEAEYNAEIETFCNNEENVFFLDIILVKK